MAKYIIEIEDEPIAGLYRAKEFNTLVFDEEGLRRLESYEKPRKAYYYITDKSEIRQEIDTCTSDDARRMLVGNYFYTLKEAVDAKLKIQNLFTTGLVDPDLI